MSDSTGFGLKDLEYLVNGEYASGSSSTSRPLGVLNRPLSQIDANVRLLASILAVQHKSDGSLKNLSVEEGMLADGAVTQDKIASGVVTNLPVGFIYFQLRGQHPPEYLFGTSGKWQDVSSVYAGEFFRVSGGNSNSFGITQPEGLPNIIGETSANAVGKSDSINSRSTGAFIPVVSRGSGTGAGENNLVNSVKFRFNAANSNTIYGASKHVTPYNSAIRIWKKIA